MEIRTVILFLFHFYKFVNFVVAKDNFKTEYKWAQIEFDFASEQEREEAIKNGTFAEGKVQPIDVEVYYCKHKGKKIVFTTFPRISDGIPATLGTVTKKHREGNPIVAPYPNWEWHTNPERCNSHRIVSVYRVRIDSCDRLWVLDNGIVGSNQVCPPQILAFDLRTNLLLRKYEIPFDQHLNTSLLLTPVVESYFPYCEDTFVYNADSMGPSLLVYDYKKNKSWRIIDKTFFADPRYNTYNIAGKTFEVMDGILGLALSPPTDVHRKLFYHAMSSGTEQYVYTKYLQDETLFANGSDVSNIFYTYPKTRKTQSAAEAMDKLGNLFFGLLGDIKIASWNIRYPYGYKNFRIVGDNEETMQFPSGIKVVPDEKGKDTLWVFATAYQRYASNSLFLNQTNFIILSANVWDLLPRK